VVRRDVVRLVTPGTSPRTSCSTPAPTTTWPPGRGRRRLGLAWLDISTGAFQAQPVAAAGLAATLARLAPGELLVPTAAAAPDAVRGPGRVPGERLTPLPAARFDSANGARRLEALFGVDRRWTPSAPSAAPSSPPPARWSTTWR
jgi:DNA mismatch repair protein MutS